MFKIKNQFLLNENNGKPNNVVSKSSNVKKDNDTKANKDSKLEYLLSLVQITYKKIKNKETRGKFENYVKNIVKKYEDNQDAEELKDIINKIISLNNQTQSIDDFFNDKKEKKNDIERFYSEEERVAREKRIGGRLVKLEEEEKMKKQLTPDFNLTHFLFCNLPSDDILPNIEKLAKNLQIIADKIQKKILIISAYRSAERSKILNPTVKDSQHPYGTAADIYIKGLSPLILYTFIEKLIKKGEIEEGGLGIYDDYVHYDVRGTNVRWDRRLVNKGVYSFSEKEKKIINNLISSLS